MLVFIGERSGCFTFPGLEVKEPAARGNPNTEEDQSGQTTELTTHDRPTLV